MRSLAWYVNGVLKYSDDDVRERLASENYNYGARFDIVNRDLSYVGPLNTVVREPGNATVEWNADRGIQGALTLQCDGDDQLRGRMFNRYIKPWIRFDMPAGDIVEYPMGVFLVTAPQREVSWKGSERWTFNGLPDFGYLFDSTGPGTWGIRVTSGINISDAVKLMLALAGFFDASGLTYSNAVFPENRTYYYLTPRGEVYDNRQRFESQLSNLMRSRNAVEDAERHGLNPDGAELVRQWHEQVNMTRLAIAMAKLLAPDNDAAPVTYQRVSNEWLDTIGFEPVAWDHTGRPRTEAAKDLTTAPIEIDYVTDSKSIIEKVTAGTDAQGWFNKAIMKTENSEGLYTQLELDANNIWPDHPLAQKNCGFFRDQYFTEQNAENEDQLILRGVAQLQQGLAVAQTLQMTTDPMPCHEHYGVVGTRIVDDPELAARIAWSERMWAIDLFGWKMEHGLRRLFR
jgi:hypothetical protein